MWRLQMNAVGALNAVVGMRARLLLLVLAAIVPFTAFIAYQIVEIRDRRTNEALERAIEYAKVGAEGYENTISEAKALLELVARIHDVTSGPADACQ